MIRRLEILFVLLALVVAAPAIASIAAHVRTDAAEASGDRLAAKKKQKGKKNKGKGKKGKGRGGEEAESTDESAPTPAAEAPAAPATPAAAPVLDLTSLGAAEEEKAKEQLLQGESEQKEDDKKGKKKKAKDGSFDFGGGGDVGSGEITFGLEDFSLDSFTLDSPERQRFDDAIAMMSEEDYTKAAAEFRFFLEEPKYAEFHQEAQYQLAKALYKLGFLDPALAQYKKILEVGPSHRRYSKSIEWLFFIARKMADETPVLAELARFRGVTFPKAYRDEYNFLLAKYLFVQAQRFEVERLRQLELERGKKSKAVEINFDEVVKGGDVGAIDFSQGFDFGGGGDSGGGGFDFGGGGGGGGGSGGGGFDFGGGGGGGGESGGGFDFGGGGGGEGGGGFDFGAGEEGKKPAAPAGPTREEAPRDEKEAIKQGVTFAEQVEEEGKFGPRGTYLKGLLHFLDGNAQEAVKSFQQVVRVLNPKSGTRLDPQLREMAFLSLARVHYGAQQFDRSVYYYDLIDRDSESWLTALFEASWAYYRRGDFEKALGNLLTLHSPFFEREYFPESQIVKAIIYFEACRYEETRGIVDDFLARFTKVMKEIEKIAQSKEAPEQLYEKIRSLQAVSSDKDDDVTTRVVNLALGHDDIKTARDVVRQVEEELALWNEMSEEWKTSKVGRETLDDLKALSAARAKQAGETTRAIFEAELYELKGLLAQALRIKLEVTRAERTVIEKRLAGEANEDEVVPAAARIVVDDDHVYWPYEGEYWRDELGTYELDFSMCRPMAAK